MIWEYSAALTVSGLAHKTVCDTHRFYASSLTIAQSCASPPAWKDLCSLVPWLLGKRLVQPSITTDVLG